MPILQCEYNGVTVDIDIRPQDIPRVESAIRFEGPMKMEEWDALSKRARAKMRRDHEWFYKLLTREKIKGTRRVIGMWSRNLGDLRGNAE